MNTIKEKIHIYIYIYSRPEDDVVFTKDMTVEKWLAFFARFTKLYAKCFQLPAALKVQIIG